MLTPLERAVVDVEVAFIQLVGGHDGGAGFESFADGTELQGDQLGLRHDSPAAVQDGRRSVPGLA